MLNFIKKIILSAFLIYAFNMVAINFNVVVPMNIWTVGFISCFDVSGLIVLMIIKTIGV